MYTAHWVLEQSNFIKIKYSYTIETGFHVVDGAVFGCQFIPPVNLFSPGWFQWISLRKQLTNINTKSEYEKCTYRVGVGIFRHFTIRSDSDSGSHDPNQKRYLIYIFFPINSSAVEIHLYNFTS